MFVGPAQVGKLTAALEFAMAVNCLKPESLGCGTCRECVAIGALNHPDVRVWDVPEGEKTFKVERVRELIGALGYHPYQGRRKVHIVAGMDAIGLAGANALLKTLEEPPPSTTLVLLSKDAESVLPTILSRCQVIPFGLTPPEAIAEALMKRFPLMPETARELAFQSQGRLGRAIELASAPPAEPVAPKWPEGDWLAWADAMAALPEREQTAQLDAMLAWLRDVVLVGGGAGYESLRHPHAVAELESWAAQAPASEWIARARQLEEAREALGRHANARLVFDRLGKTLS